MLTITIKTNVRDCVQEGFKSIAGFVVSIVLHTLPATFRKGQQLEPAFLRSVYISDLFYSRKV